MKNKTYKVHLAAEEKENLQRWDIDIFDSFPYILIDGFCFA